jgi:hypothetical protein
LLSCTTAGCTTEACGYTNDGATRTPHLSLWSDGNGSGGCSLDQYGMDGLCDCGCGVSDPDCETGKDCTGKGCVAGGCEVCHEGTQLNVCYGTQCDPAVLSDDVCDCGCGTPDPACPVGGGCRQPGCKDSSGVDGANVCVVCHDPFGRAVPCP